VILVLVRGALSIVVPPLFRRIREHPVALHVRTPDSVLHVWSALLCLVTLISKLSHPVLLTLKRRHSWTNGYASSLRMCQLSQPTVLMTPRSTLTPPYLTLQLILHPDHPAVAEGAVGANRGFAFVSGNVSVVATARGVGRATLRTSLSTPPVSCWTVDGISRLAVSPGSSPNLGSPRTGPLTERLFLVLTRQETLIGVYNHPLPATSTSMSRTKSSIPSSPFFHESMDRRNKSNISPFCYRFPSPSVYHAIF